MKRFIHRVVLTTIFLALAGFNLGAQETASRYFEVVSEQYRAISDYTTDLVITNGEEIQIATVQYKNPNLLRLDFSDPEGMVIAVNAEKLLVWVPRYSVTFEQTLRRNQQDQMLTMATSKGLELMARYYTIAYATSPNPVPLDEKSSEQVIKLHLVWKSNNEGFRKLELSINPSLKMIRRIQGVTTNGETFIFDFTNIVLNRGIPDIHFNYESPPIGNSITNFLFDPEDE